MIARRRQIRIKGIVREATALRQALATPMTARECEALRKRVNESICQIEMLLRQNNALLNQLPAPSRRAYAFLKQFDPAQAKIVDGGGAAETRNHPRRESITFRGLRPFLDTLLDDIARNIATVTLKTDKTLKVIQQTAERLEHDMASDDLGPEHLTQPSRQMLAWFRYFADADTFDTYVAAVGRARSAFACSTRNSRWQLPLLIHFRPSGHLYRWRACKGGTRIVLSVPMISFDEHTFRMLGQQMHGEKQHRPAIAKAQLSEDYQATLMEFEAALGAIEQTAGAHHDLAASYDRINETYFSGQMARPRLAWIRTPTGSVFGHYDEVHDRLCISSTLDHPNVPAFVLDHVMHHELLHKKHGSTWCKNRRHSHTPTFRKDEKAFAQFAEADRFLATVSTKV
jgi:hypothetical protein